MLIKGGKIIDGTGEKAYKADIRIKGEKISAIGDLKPATGEDVIDASGLCVSPGFVDILNHSDAFLTLLENSSQDSLLQQGITTVLMGNCGSSLAPLRDAVFVNSIQKWGDVSKINVNWLRMEEYLDELHKHDFGLNIATLIGHSTVRRGFTFNDPRKLNSEEMRQMEYMMEEALHEGAFGISTGLAYAHGNPATREELEIVMRLAKKYNALYSTHIRNEAENFSEAVDEALSLAAETGASIELSHFKVTGERLWDKYLPALEKIKAANNVNFDIYPYTATASVLYSFLPEWATERGNRGMFKNIERVEKRQKLLRDMHEDPHSYKDMVIAMGKVNPTYFGKTIGEIAQKQEKSPEEAVLNLILSSHNRIIVFTPSISEENIEHALKHPYSFVSSDGVGYKEGDRSRGEFVHPRYFGAFPKLLGEYVRDKKIISLEKAIQKITSGPAKKIGLKGRGEVKKGNFADLVIFDPKKIESAATLSSPYHYPEGISRVLVNGNVAVENREIKNMTGKILARHD